MIPSKPDLDPKTAKNLMLSLAGNSSIQKRAAVLHCQANGIKISELRDLAREIAGPPKK